MKDEDDAERAGGAFRASNARLGVRLMVSGDCHMLGTVFDIERCCVCPRQRLADLLQLFTSTAVGEEAVVADAHEAVGQDVEQEAAEEFLWTEGHGFASVMVLVVGVAEGDMVLGVFKDSTVADGGFVGVAGQVAQHLRRVVQVGFTVDDPVLCHKGIEGGVEIPGDAR